MSNKLEILAPAGNREMLGAAVFSGADAVYLGLTGFNARRTAGNFTPDELKEAVSFCHARGVKVHVTLNTLVYDRELPGLADAVRAVAEAGADAVISDDLAAARMVKTIAPTLHLHGSTQMSIHTPEGARELAALGYDRVILARELSLEEIRAVCAASPIEVEVFVHGALCMSVSGQCMMSAFLGGRSGNRGACAGFFHQSGRGKLLLPQLYKGRAAIQRGGHCIQQGAPPQAAAVGYGVQTQLLRQNFHHGFPLCSMYFYYTPRRTKKQALDKLFAKVYHARQRTGEPDTRLRGNCISTL